MLQVIHNLKWTRETTEVMCQSVQHVYFITFSPPPPPDNLGPVTYKVIKDNFLFNWLIIQ